MKEINCIMCNKKIDTSSIELKTRRFVSGLEKTYYSCPHCNFEYTIMITDQEIRQLMDKREGLKGYASIRCGEERRLREKEFHNLDAEIKKKLNKLNNK